MSNGSREWYRSYLATCKVSHVHDGQARDDFTRLERLVTAYHAVYADLLMYSKSTVRTLCFLRFVK